MDAAPIEAAMDIHRLSRMVLKWGSSILLERPREAKLLAACCLSELQAGLGACLAEHDGGDAAI